MEESSDNVSNRETDISVFSNQADHNNRLSNSNNEHNGMVGALKRIAHAQESGISIGKCLLNTNYQYKDLAISAARPITDLIISASLLKTILASLTLYIRS